MNPRRRKQIKSKLQELRKLKSEILGSLINNENLNIEDKKELCDIIINNPSLEEIEVLKEEGIELSNEFDKRLETMKPDADDLKVIVSDDKPKKNIKKKKEVVLEN